MPRSDVQRCYVYVQLPGSTEIVVCGLFEQEGGVGRFVYGRSYLENPRAVELEKFELPLGARTYRTARLGGIFGSLRDSSPDAWGRRIIERQLGRANLSEIDYLLHSPQDRAGALSFGTLQDPPAPVRKFNKVLQLKSLLEIAERIEHDADEGSVPIQVDQLINVGSSLGGARPKNGVEDDEGLWVAKFPSRTDRWNNAPVEAAMLALAAECGLRAATARIERVGRKDVILVRRFDRERAEQGYLRHRMVSALTVLRAEEDDRKGWSYVLLADELRRWVEDPDQDLRELFGRMVFNALISNTDDHPRNHALIARGTGWALSPAYDLTPSPQPSTERDLAMQVNLETRRANRQNLLRECGRFRLSHDEANRRIDEIRRIVSARWRERVREHGGTRADIERIASAFDYEGFEYRVS